MSNFSSFAFAPFHFQNAIFPYAHIFLSQVPNEITRLSLNKVRTISSKYRTLKCFYSIYELLKCSVFETIFIRTQFLF